MRIIEYDRNSTVDYAINFALKRNPKYYNFDRLGGNCTNFVSQCLYAGSKTMNYSPILGWYYNSLNDRAPAWTGVEELYRFLINNDKIGPFGSLVNKNQVAIGDVIELGKSSNYFYHSLVVSKILKDRIYVCSNTHDTLNVPLDFYSFHNARYIHIEGVRKP